MVKDILIHNAVLLIFQPCSFFLSQSREYKYNRQIFDINAQVWTEKYASPTAVGAIGWGSVDAGVLVNKNPTFFFAIFVLLHYDRRTSLDILLSIYCVLKFWHRIHKWRTQRTRDHCQNLLKKIVKGIKGRCGYWDKSYR
jgi:hypothetical protein